MAHFELGDLVHWTSQSGGWVKHKLGTVVHVVRPGEWEDYRVHPDLVGSSVFRRGGYVVAVQQGGKRKDKLYAPLVKNLRKVVKLRKREEEARELIEEFRNCISDYDYDPDGDTRVRVKAWLAAAKEGE